jgi:hypothetical protein
MKLKVRPGPFSMNLLGIDPFKADLPIRCSIAGLSNEGPCCRCRRIAVATNVAKPLDAGGVDGRFEPPARGKSFRMDADGTSGQRPVEFVIRGSGVQIPPPAPSY